MVRACVLLASMRFSPGTGAQPPNHPLFFYDKRESEGGRRAERRRTSYITKENIWGKKIKRRRRSSLSLYIERASMLYPPLSFSQLHPRTCLMYGIGGPIPLCQLDRPLSLSLSPLTHRHTHTPTRYGGMPPSRPFPTLSRRVLDETTECTETGGKKESSRHIFSIEKKKRHHIHSVRRLLTILYLTSTTTITINSYSLSE